MSEQTTSTVQDTPKAVENVNNVVANATTQATPVVDAAASAQAQHVQTEIASKEAEAAAKGSEEQQAKSNVPEKYELNMPEQTLLEAEAVERIAGIARERGLSNEQAQELLDMEHDAVATYHNKQVTAFLQRADTWKQEVVNDKEIGGDNLNKTVSLVNRFLEKYDVDGSFRKDLEVTKYGNHPGLIKVLYRAAKESFANDEFVQAPLNQGGSKKSVQDILYPSNEGQG
jgi:hypothetical protein